MDLVSTISDLVRYKLRRMKLATSPMVKVALATVLLTVAFVSQAQAAEAPLSPEFLQYLGTVESSSLKEVGALSLEEFYRVLKHMLQESTSKTKQEENSSGKGSVHGKQPQK